MLPLRRRSRRWISLVSPLLGFVILFQLLRGPQWSLFAQDNTVAHEDDGDFLCPPMPGIDDVLVVLKTGVTEALEKVPVHLRTTFRCIPHYVIFSDFAEKIGGVQVHDVLRSVDDEVKQNVPDFNLYNRLQLYGRTGLLPSDNTQEENGAFGMPNNPGWKLDKWKFLPMIDESLQRKPDAKWFVFMEADTHIEWPNLMAWLARLDPDQPLYLGTETQIADVLFAHGGSGFIISNPAVRLVSEYRRSRVAELDEYTDGHWAGDCVLGKVLADAGVPLTFSWPLLQNSRLGEVEPLTNAFYRQPWCYPIVGFHHLTPLDVEQMWRFDQDWFVKVSYCPEMPPSIHAQKQFANRSTTTEKTRAPSTLGRLSRTHLSRDHDRVPDRLGQSLVGRAARNRIRRRLRDAMPS